mmetsp:Transcript_40669/g.132859  ORF Transcript_40669/g.132859 Transcript_40669/m.132859 type:complete len:346 (-) Transcript_40669:453-1490(-)
MLACTSCACGLAVLPEQRQPSEVAAGHVQRRLVESAPQQLLLGDELDRGRLVAVHAGRRPVHLGDGGAIEATLDEENDVGAVVEHAPREAEAERRREVGGGDASLLDHLARHRLVQLARHALAPARGCARLRATLAAPLLQAGHADAFGLRVPPRHDARVRALAHVAAPPQQHHAPVARPYDRRVAERRGEARRRQRTPRLGAVGAEEGAVVRQAEHHARAPRLHPALAAALHAGAALDAHEPELCPVEERGLTGAARPPHRLDGGLVALEGGAVRRRRADRLQPSERQALREGGEQLEGGHRRRRRDPPAVPLESRQARVLLLELAAAREAEQRAAPKQAEAEL